MFPELQSTIFSDLIEQNADVKSYFSPNGLNFGYTIQCQLILLDVKSQKIVQKFICDYPVDCFEWSPDSELVYCCMKKQGSIQVWSLINPAWRCKIMENPLAIAEVYWAPDSRHLLVINEFHLKITVWSFVSTTTAIIENPKPIKNCICFSYCERYLAVTERKKCEDCISIYTCDTYEILKFFPVETKDLSGIYFSPSDLILGVLEAYTEEPKVAFYSIDGRILGKYVRSSMFGFTTFSWNPDGKLIAIGDYFGMITILNSSNYEEIFSYQENESIDCEKTTVYKINPKSVEHEASGDVSSTLELFEVRKGKPFVLATLGNLSEKNKCKPAKCGIKTLGFSHCGNYLLSLNGSFPKVLFVFDINTLMLSSVILHHHKIKDVSWHPRKSLLAICCSSRNVNLWMPTCCVSLWSPFRDECPIFSAEWCSREDCLLLNGKNFSAILYLPNVDLSLSRSGSSTKDINF
ncbi:WD repeat-containing protein WRAP73-like isoform X1 [Argiope bruennichi]|uniref:WD repeat-containing protein WRAP73-like isoform X1 n=1 Tax=Argiope bruennichi TaxID=94029 RepID=UPI0024951408|nr:WD repeat-containing protein WRAP73-like isoform X1 [Argiope bruennichi]XP_055953427.1 WD repeat-containing protein WRAP73-like isoform X1 [Argiope bruennichi]